MLQNVWDFFQDEILGMKWLNRLIGSGLEAAGLDTGGKVGGSIQFFIYDVVKIMVLLGFLILMISYIQSYFPPERTKKILGRFKGIGANIIAALLGTVTPFCSCSSIPLFIGFTSAGLPLGVTFSFLISSPMVDLGSLVLLMSIFGWKVAIVYVIVGLVIAVVGGTIIEKLHLENQVHEFIRNGHAMDAPQEELTKKDRLKFAWDQVVETAKKVAPYVLVGVGIGAFIHKLLKMYNNRLITSAEVIEELLNLSKEMAKAYKAGDEKGLSVEELAFYDALAADPEVLKKMQDKVLVEMAQELTELIRRSRTVDWDKKESARAYMRTQVKHLLRKYKYPPEKAKGAIDIVIKQAELMSSNINPESVAYDFQPRTKPLMVAEESVYGMNEKDNI